MQIITDTGLIKSYRLGDQFHPDNGLDNRLAKDIEQLIENYWKPASSRPKFYRTREELESLAGLGIYDKVAHRYENGDNSVIGIEITFENIDVDDLTKVYPRLRSFTIWDERNPVASDFPAMLEGKRIVVRKETVAALVRHIDPVLAWNFNQHRAFLLEVTIGSEDNNGQVDYYAILRHVHHFIDDFRCAESDNPVPIPPRKPYDD